MLYFSETCSWKDEAEDKQLKLSDILTYIWTLHLFSSFPFCGKIKNYLLFAGKLLETCLESNHLQAQWAKYIEWTSSLNCTKMLWLFWFLCSQLVGNFWSLFSSGQYTVTYSIWILNLNFQVCSDSVHSKLCRRTCHII